jgi:hypothetical protein
MTQEINPRGCEMEKRLYVVEDGKAFEIPADDLEQFDGTESVVLAYNEEDALRIASMYDAGQLDIDNHIYCGVTVSAVSD